ncbi:MAG TPA: TonB family protein [Bryobacteraceae bacterium]|nr:TonB family protein [Bryobacteraceae bacterium]
MSGWNQAVWPVLSSVAFKGTVVLGVAWLVAFLLRRRSAAARHLVWTAAAAALLALPLLSISLPSLRVRAPGALAPLNTGLVFRVFGVSGADQASQPALPGAVPARPASGAPWRPDVRLLATLVWVAGTSALWLQMLIAYLAMARARRAARRFACPVLDRVPVLETAPSGMPMAFGIRKPVIFMPADAVEWTEERQRVVLLHELAHVRRGDVATQLLARTALGLNWWNPLAWIAWREFLKERERAADDLVLSAGASASAYAGHLLELARSLQSSPATAWAAVAMARRSQLEGRLLAILDSKVNRGAAGRASLAAAVFVALVLVAPFAAIRGQQSTAQVSAPEIDATILAANTQKNHEILENAASTYIKLQKYDVAQKLLESALAIRGEVSGEQSADYAAGLVKLGDLAVQRGKSPDQAIALYTQAVSLGDRREVAPALLYLGRNAYGKHNLADLATAIDFLQRAVNVDPGGPTAGPAYTWMARVREKQQDGPLSALLGYRGGDTDAELFYQRALAIEDTKSPEAALTMELYSRFLRTHDRASEADLMDSQAKEIRLAHSREIAASMLKVTAQLAATSGVYRVGAGVTSPMLSWKLEPQYTEEARAEKYAGTVLVYIEVGTDGMAHNIKVIKSIGMGLDEKAVEAISQWKFNPGTKDGAPVTVAATVEVNFRLL